MTNQLDTWLAGLVRDFPALGPEYEKELEARGRVTPVILMNHFSTWLVRTYKRGDRPTAQRFLRRLDEDYGGLNEQSKRLVCNAFVRHLPWPGKPGSGVVRDIGPVLLVEYERSHHRGLRAAQWVARLVQDVPWLEPMYTEHMRDFGKLLPALLLGDIVRWLEGALTAGKTAEARALLGHIEDDYSALDSRAQRLVSDGFVWMLPNHDMPGAAEISSWLGPTLRTLYESAHRSDREP